MKFLKTLLYSFLTLSLLSLTLSPSSASASEAYAKSFIKNKLAPQTQDYGQFTVTAVKSCTSNDGACYISDSYFKVKQKGIKELPTVISKLPDRFKNNCYEILPQLGSLLAKENMLKSSNLVSMKFPCQTQLAEGFFDYYFQSLALDKLVAITKSYCTAFSKEISWSCSIHLGMAHVDKELTDPLKAVNYCYLIPSVDDTRGEHRTTRRACMSGAWQEFFRNSKVLQVFARDKATSRDIFSFCLSSERSAKEVCLQEDSYPFWNLQIFPDNNSRFAACREFLDYDIKDQCYFGMGRGVANSFNSEPAKVIVECLKLQNSEDRDYCAIAAGEALNVNTIKPILNKICTTTGCLRALGESLYGMSAGDHQAALTLCNLLPTTSKDYCTLGIYSALSRIGFVRFVPTDLKSIYSKCLTEVNPSPCQSSALSGADNYLKKFGGAASILKECNLNSNLYSKGISCSYSYGYYLASISGKGTDCEKIKNMNSCVKGYLTSKSLLVKLPSSYCQANFSKKLSTFCREELDVKI